MIDIVLTAVLLISYFTASWFAARYFIHMFQLNSYKPGVQAKWVINNSKTFFAVHGLVLLLEIAISLTVKSHLISAAVVTAAFITLTILERPKKSYKVPLKYTMRIKRLIITSAVIYALPAASAAFLPLGTVVPVLSAFLLLTPWLVLFANLLNRPLEKTVANWYINDAKRILKSCPDLTVIGITGSFGKTSVKYFLDALLSVKYNVLKTPGNFNTPLGVVRTIRESLRATHDIFLCEMGAKNVGDIKEICDIVRPKHGVITSVGPMHLESFKSLDNVKKTKFELADALSEDGKLYLNLDDENIRSFAEKRSQSFISYGIDSREGYYVTDLKISGRGSEFTVHTPSGGFCFYKTELIGRHNVINIAGAIAVSHSMGIPLEALVPAVRRLESVPHRLQLINKGDYSVIDDAYNSNPAGAKAALETLSMTDGMKILVTPGMIELGDRQYELNREFGVRAAKVCDFVALVGIEQTKPIFDGLKEAGYPEEKIFRAESLNEAMNKVYSLTSGGKRKIILLENDLPDNY